MHEIKYGSHGTYNHIPAFRAKKAVFPITDYDESISRYRETICQGCSGRIREIVQGAGYQMALSRNTLIRTSCLPQDADALIVRSDKVTAEVVAAAPQLKIVVRAGAIRQRRFGACTSRGIVVMNAWMAKFDAVPSWLSV